MPASLVRPRDGRVIGGVCAGLAHRFGTTTSRVRIVALLSCLLPGPQCLLYLALWVLIPAEDQRLEAW